MPATTYTVAWTCPAPAPATGPAPPGTGIVKDMSVEIVDINAAGTPALNPPPGETWTWTSSNPAISATAVNSDVNGKPAVLLHVATPNPYSASNTTITATISGTSNYTGLAPQTISAVVTQPAVTPFDNVAGFLLGTITQQNAAGT